MGDLGLLTTGGQPKESVGQGVEEEELHEEEEEGRPQAPFVVVKVEVLQCSIPSCVARTLSDQNR